MSRLAGLEVISTTCPDDGELGQVWELKNACERYDHASVRLLPTTVGKCLRPGAQVLLGRMDGLLVAFLWTQVFGHSVAEMTGMVHPAYRRRCILSEMLLRSLADCATAGVPGVECITDSSSASGVAFLAAAGASRSHSEHRMRWQPVDIPPVPPGRVRLERAGHKDAAALARIDAECFDLPFTIAEHEAFVRQDLAGPDYVPLFITLDRRRIGKVSLWTGDAPFLFYGFCLLPAFRGRGYGRESLLAAVHLLRSMSDSQIELEVDADNTNAIALYQSCGFQRIATYDYFVLPLRG